MEGSGEAKPLEAIWQAYKEAVKAQGSNRAQALYREMVWPHLLDLWKSEPRVRPRPEEFRVSIHTLGTSPEATILAILGTKAKKVYVLHTAESERYLEQIRKDTGKEIYPIRIDKSDVARIYEEVHRLLKEIAQGSGAFKELSQGMQTPVALDITSGTKAMSAGLAAAGFFFQRFYANVRVVYVDNEEYDTELRRPRAGSEVLILLPNPHEVVGEVDVFFARELYLKRDFSGAAGYFKGLVSKTNQLKYTLYNTLCEMYANWWALDFKNALKQGESLLNQLGKDANLNHPLAQHMVRLQKQVDLLREAEAFVSKKDLGGSKGVLGVVATLLRLSEEEKRPFLKVLYVYRALELLLQERLYRLYGRKADEPNLSPKEQEDLQAELARILSEEPRVDKRLGLLHLVAFLRVLGDPLLKGESLEEVKALSGVVQARNNSLLIHGLEVPSEKQVDIILKKAKRLRQELESQVRFQPDLEPIDLEF